jgi:hypothetical protein
MVLGKLIKKGPAAGRSMFVPLEALARLTEPKSSGIPVNALVRTRQRVKSSSPPAALLHEARGRIEKERYVMAERSLSDAIDGLLEDCDAHRDEISGAVSLLLALCDRHPVNLETCYDWAVRLYELDFHVEALRILDKCSQKAGIPALKQRCLYKAALMREFAGRELDRALAGARECLAIDAESENGRAAVEMINRLQLQRPV